ncbi:hypothetical protein ABW19_dt0202876 [Dactylella cylindrospora]|nr:hypothetical protein ABW19_dt0202876 [Dactylella cylindrospora]
MAEDKPKRIAFIPLESNPTTFTSLAHTLGLSSALSFVDVYSVTDPDLLSFIPRPVHALILIFPVSASFEAARSVEDADKTLLDTPGDEPVLWIRQTIKNACGLMGLLHSVLNGSAKKSIIPGSNLAELLASAVPLEPTARAKLLETSPSLAAAHKDAATSGDTEAPDAEAEVEHHYVAYIKSDKDGKVYEMDGSRKGPLVRVEAGDIEGDDLLGSEKLRQVLQERMEAANDPNFGILALVDGEGM